jgi:uncharacterized repeat protein (TIGR01451 family)
VAAGQQYPYTIHYGSGYPVLGTGPIVQELADEMLVGLTLPDGYQFIDSSLAPVSTATGHPVWEMLIPEPGQGGIIEVTLEASAGPSTPPDDRLWLWVMDDPGGTPPDPPASLDWSTPPDATWGGPPDVLPQDVETDPKADLWVYKSGATFGSPGDTITYRLLVGNCGLLPAAGYGVEDLLFGILDTPSLLSAWPPDLDPGETWETVVSYELPWYLSEGLVLHNAFYTPSSPAEANTDNNVAWWDTTVTTAHDPNCISVSPQGVVWSGDTLTYTIECENVGAGTAYGVYVVAQLDPALDDATLVLPRGVGYDPVSRVLFQPVGALVSGAGDSFSFSVDVADTVAPWHSIVGQAIVYFASVPEETYTNIVVNPVSLLFPDVPPGHWAFNGVSAACAHRVVAGYPDGFYRPDRVVTRDQMAVYISRAMAGRAECVPPGPDTPTFPDVLPNHWAYKYVEYAAANGVVEGYPNGYYRPDYGVSRAQMAVFIARAIAEPTAGEDLADYTPPDEPTFADVPTDFWCYRHAEYLAEKAVVLGYPDGLYRPAAAVTRDQMAVYVARAYDLLP